MRELILWGEKAEIHLLQASFIFFCFIAVVVLLKLCKGDQQYEFLDVQMGYPSSVVSSQPRK